MAAAPDQSLSDAASSLGRSSSIDARDGALARSDSQRRSASKLGRKGGRSGNDLFVCFAPRTTLNLVSASRPVVSPARDKGKESGSARRSGRTLSASIFSSKGGAPKKQGYDDATEEPTSPKVTCIGQVRSKSKNEKKNKGSPGSSRKQGSFGHAEGKKESACSSFAKDFSCFGLPCDSYGSLPSFRGDKKSSGTVFAKSLVLIQREDEVKSAVAMEAPTVQLHAQSSQEKDKKGGELPSLSRPGLLEEEKRTENLAFTPTTVPVMGVREANNTLEALQSKEIAEDQTSVEEDDTFETDPPPANALLLMRNTVEHLRVLVPPPSINITLKRSTSAPVHRRRKSEDGNDGDQPHAPDDADHVSGTQKRSSMEARRETSSVLISSEDLPKPANVSKSFLQRCKSVSRSLSRSSGESGEEAKSSPATQDVKAGQDACDAAVVDEHKDELHLVSEALSRRRSDSEALKVSLDIVPETWLWEARAVARQERKETTGSGRRLEMKQAGGAGAEWLDGELEAALWKSCQVAEARPASCTGREAMHTTPEPLPALPDESNSAANQALDAEVEATLWRCCSLVASHPSQDEQSEPKTGEVDLKTDESGLKTTDLSRMQEAANVASLEESVKLAANLDKSPLSSSSNLGRSTSYGSQSGKHILERGFSLRRSASVGAGRQNPQQQVRGKIDRKTSTEQVRKEKTTNAPSHNEISSNGQASVCQSDVGDARNAGSVGDVGIVGVATSEGYASSCVLEAELWCAGRPPNGCLNKSESKNTGGLISGAEHDDITRNLKHEHGEEAMDAEDDIAAPSAPSPSSVLDRRAPPPSPAPTTPPEAVLFLRYDLSAFRISLDASAKTEAQADQHHQQQQKAMLEAISHLHIHDVQRTYTRLLKAASGKERASLSSAAFRLQRCKSEPVRLASY
eukprot:c24625_g3_i1 orf=429-3173(+)